MWLWIALASSLAWPAERPRYGGELRVQLRAPLRTLDIAARPPDPADAAAQGKVLRQVFETLVEMDDRGAVLPALAATWTHDAPRKRWIFTPRPNAAWHDGQPVEPSYFPDDRPIEQLLRELSQPQHAVVRAGADHPPLGTGPFRIAEFESGRRVKLQAHTGHWAGRPFLDTVEFAVGRAWREQSLAFDVGNADVVEIPWNEFRRSHQRPFKVMQSRPTECISLFFDSPKVPPNVRDAVALAIDRSSIHNVLLLKQGEATGALLPQWLSGWAFTFPALRDVARAKRVAPNATLTFAYDKQDALLRAIGDRIVLNASEASIALKPAAGPSADLRLGLLRLNGPDPLAAVREVAGLFRLPPQDDAYALERLLLEDHRIVPLFHLPATYLVSTRVRNWQGNWVRSDNWRLVDVWLDRTQ
ncbi:MAG: hypothetical protein HY820_41125 [Acidobacteria bacterium]|nr:hypothetical protein [Acidobacteriota bacterium]